MAGPFNSWSSLTLARGTSIDFCITAESQRTASLTVIFLNQSKDALYLLHTLFFFPLFSFWREGGIFVLILSFAFLSSGKVIYVGQIWSQWLICVKPVALSWFRAVQDPALLQQLNVGVRRSLTYFEWLITFRAHLMNSIVPDLKSKPGYIN